MHIKNRYISLVFKILIVLTCLAGQVLCYIVSDPWATRLLYYTNMSNNLCLVFFVLAAVHEGRNLKNKSYTPFAPRFNGAVVMSITATMLIFWLILDRVGFTMAALYADADSRIRLLSQANNLIVHLYVPLLTILDWLLFTPKGLCKRTDPCVWLAIPLAYYGLSVVIAQTDFRFYDGGRYPYFFLNPDIIGTKGVAMYVAGMILGFLALGYVIFAIDRLLYKLGMKKGKQAL